MKQLPKHPRVLDLCCGTGCETMRLQQLGAEAAGIDFSETSIEIARQRNGSIPFYVDNMLNDYTVKDGTDKSDKQSFTAIDGENYDRDFYFHTLEELKHSSEGMFDFVEEVYPNGENPWKKYLFRKSQANQQSYQKYKTVQEEHVMNIRLAAMDDLPQLKAMYDKIIENMDKNNINIWDEWYPYELFSDDIKKKQLYVLTENTDIVSAFAMCDSMDGADFVGWKEPQAKALYINRLGVNADYSRKGIGSAALREAIALAAEKGAAYVRLFVVDSNDPAIRFYKRNGFLQLSETYDEVIDEELVLHEYAFEIMTSIRSVSL